MRAAVWPAPATGACWAALVAVAAAVARPRPSRIRELPRPAAPRRRAAATERLGTAVLGAPAIARGRRAGAPDPVAARRVGCAVVAGAVVLPVMPWAAIPAAAVAWSLPAVAARRRQRRRLAAIEDDLPEVVDLLLLATGAGLSVRQALDGVARHSHGPLAAELRRLGHDVARGRRLADALDDLPPRAGEPVRPLVAVLVAADRYGAPLGPGLERLADDVRATCRRRAEEFARRVPVKLLFPLVACILPAFALLTVAPLIASALRSLRLP
jgi:tight adherence protein C